VRRAARPLRSLSTLINKPTDDLVRHRAIWFGIVALLFLLAFNGEWRVGRDSAIYRGLGHHLATGRGYTFGIFASKTVYPGFPLLLAGIERVFGRGALAPLLVMLGLTAASMVMTYRLIALRYPQWMAVAVVALLGFNAWFIELSAELLTDVPFFLGVVLALYGWERLRLGRGPAAPSAGAGPPAAAPVGWRRFAVPAAYLLVGLVIAASTRPTFWILAIAWGAAGVWGLARGRRRKLNLAILAAMAVIAVAFVLLDPRTSGFHPLGGGAEHEVVQRLRNAGATLRENVPSFLHETFPEAFFGAEMPGVLAVITIFIAIAPALLLLARGHVLWGLFILATVAATLLTSVVPRYYLMVMPLLLLGWLLVLTEIAHRIPPRFHHALLIAGFAAVMVPNIARGVRVIADQRYRDPGHLKEWADEIRMARLIEQTLPPGARVLGPGAAIMSYFSDRQVYMAREIIPKSNNLTDVPRFLAAQHIEYAVFPSAMYNRTEWLIGELMNRGVIVPLERVAATDEMVLATVDIDLPPDGSSWRKLPETDAATIERVRELPTRTEKRDEALERAAAKVRREAKAAKARKEERERTTMGYIWRAATTPLEESPATAPAGAAATTGPSRPRTGARTTTPSGARGGR
jgi:hypothetical protein